jgi:hypothetical protein
MLTILIRVNTFIPILGVAKPLAPDFLGNHYGESSMKKTATLATLTLVLVFAVLAQQMLSNDSVTKMVKAGLGDDTITSMIKTQPGSYTLDPDSVIALKKAGVSEKVINAMIEKNTANAAPPPAPVASSIPVSTPPALVDEVGVYYKDRDNKWVELLPEVVNWKTGGFLKSLATDGIVKGDLNGSIKDKTSHYSLNTPLDFLIYMPEGVAITEYQLLRLRESGNSREFRSMTGGVVHSSGGAQRDEVEFQSKKIAPRMYEVELGRDLRAGEYGFLPPGATSSSNMASSGKMYTFHIIE